MISEKYKVDDKIFSELKDKDLWVKNDIFNFIKGNTLSEELYYFQLVTRTTNSGKSEYSDFLAHSGTEDNKLFHVNQLIQHFKKYGTVACIHVDGGKEEKSLGINIQHNQKEQHITRKIKSTDILKINHSRFNYSDSTQINRENNMKNYLFNCLNAQPSIDHINSDYFLHYISVSIGRNINYSERTTITAPSYYGFGSALFFITKDEKPPEFLAYHLSYSLNKKLLSELIDNISDTKNEKEKAIRSNQEIIEEMTKITEHVENARKISYRVQAKLDNFGKVFSSWYQESMEKIFSNEEINIGRFFYFNEKNKKFFEEYELMNQHTVIGGKEDYKRYLKRIIATTEEYFSPSKRDEYPFIKNLYNRLESDNNCIDAIKKIKKDDGYQNINSHFPIGLMLFFFQEKYHKDAYIDIKHTDISHIAILNGLKKLFFNNDFFESTEVNISSSKRILKIEISLENNGASKLFSKLIDFHNREPHPSRRTTTYMIRQLMGIDENNYAMEDFAIHERGRYKTGLTLSGDYLIEAFEENGIFILEYTLKKEYKKKVRA